MIIGSLEDIVTRLDMRVNTLELRLKTLEHRPELQPEPQPDLEATIRSLHESNDGLRNQLADAKQTERDLDAEIVALQKENHRLTRLAWQAEQDKRGAEAIAKAAAEELEQISAERDLALEQLDAARRGHADMKNRLDATSGAHRVLVQHVVEQRRRLLSILGTEPPANDRCDND